MKENICKNCKYWNLEGRIDPREADCNMLGCSDGRVFDLYYLTDPDFSSIQYMRRVVIHCQYFEEKINETK